MKLNSVLTFRKIQMQKYTWSEESQGSEQLKNKIDLTFDAGILIRHVLSILFCNNAITLAWQKQHTLRSDASIIDQPEYQIGLLLT